MKPWTAYHFGRSFLRVFTAALLLAGIWSPAQEPKADKDEGPEPGTPIEGIRFPRSQANNLRRRTAKLPEGFKDRYNLVLLSFGSQKEKHLDAWKNALGPIAKYDGSVGLYQVFALEEFQKDSGYFIETGLTRRVGNIHEQEKVFVTYVNQRRYQQELGIANQRFHVMLVSRQGLVFWMAPGPFAPAHIRDVKEIIAALKAKRFGTPTP